MQAGYGPPKGRPLGSTKDPLGFTLAGLSTGGITFRTLGLGCSSQKAARVSAESASLDEEVGHELYLALMALGVGDVADARHHVLHFQESANPGELAQGAEILDLLKRKRATRRGTQNPGAKGEEEHDDRARRATLWNLVTASTPHDGEIEGS